MQAPADISAKISERPGSNAGSFPFFRVLPLAGAWLMVCSSLAVHWSANPQYQYGWFVPFLSLYVAFNRWQTRPHPGTPSRRALRWAVGLSLLLCPTWMLSQPNPDWPLVNWLLTLEVVGITLCVIAAIGGRAWVRHFFFSAVFLCMAVPWPDFVEGPLMQGMMRAVAGIAVTALDLAGISALQHGNLIEVATGTVGVDEACSGIRSLQGSLMASLFLGELFRFNRGRRVLLVFLSVALAFVTNVMRAGFLAWNAAQSGLGAVDRWHDPAGMTILVVCVAAILAVALFLDRDSSAPVSLAHVRKAHPLPGWLIPGLGAWLILTVVGTELWFYDGAPAPQSPWSLVPPAGSKPMTVNPAALTTFRSDRTTHASWTDAGRKWLMYFFEWDFGPAFTRVSAQMHRPEICLPAIGGEMQADRGMVTFEASGFQLPFHAYTFKMKDQSVFVYHGVWQFRSERGLRHGPLSFHKQIAAVQSVLWRERRVGQQVAELAIVGCRDAAEADAAFEAALPTLLRRQ